MESWSDLPVDLLVEIAMRLKKIEDFTTFRSVCTWWRSAAGKDIFKGFRIDEAPLLMIHGKNNDEPFFYSFSMNVGSPVPWPVPEAKDKYRFKDARFGWILALSSSGAEVILFSPFSSSRVFQLPSFHNFPRFERDFVRNAILSANPRATSNFTVFAMMSDHVLGFWKNGDDEWSMIEADSPFTNIGYCGTKMYATDSDSRLWSWDSSATGLQLVRTFPNANPRNTPYMVESAAGDLLLITHDGDNWSVSALEVDALEAEWKPINDIGKHAIYIHHNTAVSVAGDDNPLFRPNNIYAMITEQDPSNHGHGRGKFLFYHIPQKKAVRLATRPAGQCLPWWFFPS